MKKDNVLSLFQNSPIGNFYRFSVYPNEAVRPDHHYAVAHYCNKFDLEHYAPKELWFEVSLASGSDYSGSAIERSNFEYFTKFNSKKIICNESLGYSGYAVFIRADLTNPDILDILKALEDYPLIDEDKYSEIEMKFQEECIFDSWTKREIAETLEKSFDIYDVDYDSLNDFLEYCFQNALFEFEYSGTYASLHFRYFQENLKKIINPILTLFTQNVIFKFPLDFDFSGKNQEILKAAAYTGSTLLFENDSPVTIPDYLYPNPNQITLL